MKPSKSLLLFLFALLCFFYSPKAKADHLMGGEFRWQDFGHDSFLITFVAYRDCNGISMPGQSINLSCGPKFSNVTAISTTVSKGLDITPVTSGQCSRCGTIPNKNYGDPSCKFSYGVELYTFTAKVSLTKIKGFKGYCQINMEWDQCCRSGTLTAGGNWQNMYIDASFNHCYGTENSAILTSSPILIIPVNKCFSYNPGAYDIDVDKNGNRDSIVYNLVRPKATASTYVTWTGKYTYDAPVLFDSFPKKNARWNPPKQCYGYHFDSSTGNLFFKPTKVEQSIIAYAITEYRKDSNGNYVIVGQNTRDVQVIVMNDVGTHSPSLSGINGSNSYDTSVTIGQKLCFKIKSSDVNSSDTVSIYWNKGLASRGATLTVPKGKLLPVATFCWTPDSSSASSLPYQFTADATDDVAPLAGHYSRAFRIFVRPVIADSIILSQSCQKVSFKALAKKGSYISKFLWYGDDSLSSGFSSFTHTYKKPGSYKYYLKSFSGGSSLLDSGIVVVPGSLLHLSLPHDTSVCSGTALRISSLVSGLTPYHYQWNTTDTNSFIVPVISSDTLFSLKVNNGLCRDSANIHVKAFISPATPSIALLGADTLISSLKADKYEWYRDSTLLKDTTYYIIAGISGKYQVRNIDSNGCQSGLSVPYAFTITGINSAFAGAAFHLYPNPGTGMLTIETPDRNPLQIQIQNLTGQILMQERVIQKAELDLHFLPKGIYLLRAQTTNGIRMERIVLQ